MSALFPHDDGGPAFPLHPGAGEPGNPAWAPMQGMVLRDYFAAQALSGILAGGFAETVPHDCMTAGRDAAFFAYVYADAMLEARKGDQS